MEIGKISAIDTNYNINKNQKVNFKGRLLDDRIVRETMTSSRLAEEAKRGTTWFSRALKSIRNFFSTNYNTVYKDAEGNILRADEKSGVIYSFGYEPSGKLYDVERSVSKNGIVKKRSYVNDGVETKVFYKRSKSGDVVEYTTLERDAKTGKLLILNRETDDGKTLASYFYDDAGNLEIYSKPGIALNRDNVGNIYGYLKIGDYEYSFLGREQLSLAERMKAEGKFKGIFSHILGLDAPTGYIRVERCLAGNASEDPGAVARLPLSTTIEDVLRMRENGELQNLKFVSL